MFGSQERPGIFTGSGAPIALTIAAAVLLGIVQPSSAQFFNFDGFQQRPQSQRGGFGFGGSGFGNNIFDPFQQHTPQPRWHRRQTLPPAREDFSKAPPPEKRETLPQRRVLVLGDAKARSAQACSLRRTRNHASFAQYRSRCPPNRRRPMPMRIQASLRLGPWRDRLCRCLNLPSVPISCSAARDHRRPCPTRARTLI